MVKSGVKGRDSYQSANRKSREKSPYTKEANTTDDIRNKSKSLESLNSEKEEDDKNNACEIDFSSDDDSSQNDSKLDKSVTEYPKKNEVVKQNTFNMNYLYVTFVIVLLLGIVFGSLQNTTHVCSLDTIQKIFVTQKTTLWDNLEASIDEINKFEKPSVLLYLYNNSTEDYMNELLHNISSYASCKLDYHVDPIELTSAELNSPKAIEDYGYLIEKYQDPLRKHGVMVVKHLEKIPGTVAQAFHSFCDEFSPMVPKSLFIFTMQVKHYINSDFNLVEATLRNNWSELKQDIFDPLLTRISSIIIRIE